MVTISAPFHQRAYKWHHPLHRSSHPLTATSILVSFSFLFFFPASLVIIMTFVSRVLAMSFHLSLLLLLFVPCVHLRSFRSTVNFGNHAKKPKITLPDILMGEFNWSPFNGTWITDNQYIFRDINGNILTMNVTSPATACSRDDIPPPTTWPSPLSPSIAQPSILLTANMLYQDFVSTLTSWPADWHVHWHLLFFCLSLCQQHQAAPGYFKYFLSPDRRYLLFVTMTSKVSDLTNLLATCCPSQWVLPYLHLVFFIFLGLSSFIPRYLHHF